jgi:hypothetical protein
MPFAFAWIAGGRFGGAGFFEILLSIIDRRNPGSVLV